MPLDFPSSPTNGQVYGNYYYNSTRGAWNALLPAATPNFFTNATLNTSTLIDATATASVTSVTPLIVKSLSGQTTNIQSWQDSSTTLAGINQFGGFYTSNRLTVGASSISTSAITHINTINAGNVGLLVKGSSSQTANLQEWQNSSGTILSYVDSAGNINFSGSGSFVQSSTGRALFATNAAATTPLTVKAAASQTADLQQWQSSTGAVLSEINSAGELQVPRIGVGAIMPTTTMLHSTASAVGNIPIVAQGAASQTANLQEWQNSSGTVLASISPIGVATMSAGGGGLQIKASASQDHAYMEFFPRTSAPTTRGGYFGYPSNGSTSLTINNETTNGNIVLSVNGTGQVTLPTKTYMPGAIVQVQEYRPVSGDKTVASGATSDILTATFTTKLAGSKIFMTFYTGQINHGSPQSNMLLTYLIDGVDQGLATHHIFYSDAATTTFRPAATVPLMSTSTYSAGAHTVVVRGGAYNSSITYDYQSTATPERRSRLILMEVAQ